MNPRYRMRVVATDGDADEYEIYDALERRRLCTLRWDDGAQQLCARLNESWRRRLAEADEAGVASW